MNPQIITVFFNGSMFHVLYRPEDPCPFSILTVEGKRLVDMLQPPWQPGRGLTTRQQEAFDMLNEALYKHIHAKVVSLREEVEDARTE